MKKCCIFILSVLWLSTTLGHAQVYRWVDKDGRVHFTDNQSSIPADRLDRSYELSPDTAQGKFSQGETATPATSAATEAPSPITSSEHLQWQQKERQIKERIAAAQEERQHYLTQIQSMRQAQMNPAFGGRKRRGVIEWGQSLAAVERQLDTLNGDLQQVQSKIQALEQTPQPADTADSQADSRLLDKQGNSRVHWHRRSAPLHNRIQQAQTQRQVILEQLSADSQAPVGRRGKEVLRLTQELEQVNQDLARATTDLQNLQQEGARAGAPADWLQ